MDSKETTMKKKDINNEPGSEQSQSKNTVDQLKYAVVREEILTALRQDLIGPLPEEDKEGLLRTPEEQYVTGRLFPQNSGSNTQSVCGLNFYVESNTNGIKPAKLTATISWATYKKIADKKYVRSDHSEEVCISNIAEDEWISLKEDQSLKILLSVAAIDNEYQQISLYLRNDKEPLGTSTGDPGVAEFMLFQVHIEVQDIDKKGVFVPEDVCRKDSYENDKLYSIHPVYSRGFNCAATWTEESFEQEEHNDPRAVKVETSFIPDYEINGVSPDIASLSGQGINLSVYSIAHEGKGACIQTLKDFNNDYKTWIKEVFSLSDEEFNGSTNSCAEAYNRIKNGIDTLDTDYNAWRAFIFMNRVMYLQYAISLFSGRTEKETDHDFKTFFADHMKEVKNYTWHPFQLAFILLNIVGITNPETETTERETIDLLYFPTGGGKTEAYLGLIAFTIGYRRLRKTEIISGDNSQTRYDRDYENDGGVTVILRYTLRLLTKQQRDRLTTMILAAELIREGEKDDNGKHIYGESRFSVGFWVGGKVTPNKFTDYGVQKKEEGLVKTEDFQKQISSQLSKCPFCGQKFDLGGDPVKHEYPNFAQNYHMEFEDDKAKDLKIYCSNPKCYFSYDPQKAQNRSIPVYLIDEQIYNNYPTVLIATVDKFARLPAEERAYTLFGKRPETKAPDEKDFYPPELIIQDELHLITGALGSMYGCYETLVEQMCTAQCGIKKIKPKYVVCTATVENVENQTQSLFGRTRLRPFPPQGINAGDSYFAKEVPLPSRPYTKYSRYDNGKLTFINSETKSAYEKPFRQYVGICGNGISGQEVLSRVYAVLLQKFEDLKENPKYEEFRAYLDPYFTLIGFFNTIRELGSTVWQLDDPEKIPDMIETVSEHLPGNVKPRKLKDDKREELTSRIDSDELPGILSNLGLTFDDDASYDIVLATNMIAVGLDVGRLGLMVMTGAPKSNSEYIQASSRVGRKYPGLVITVYNPNKERDISYYENFTGFHSQMYHYIEGTTATPFSEGTRKRILHTLLIGMVRMQNSGFYLPDSAKNIDEITEDVQNSYIDIISQRANIIAGEETEHAVEKEAENYFKSWRDKAKNAGPNFLYYHKNEIRDAKDRKSADYLMRPYSSEKDNTKKEDTSWPTLSSMRDVEREIKLFLSCGGESHGTSE